MCRFATGSCWCSGIRAWSAAVFTSAVVALSTARAEQNPPVPNFAPDNMTGWLKGATTVFARSGRT
jgi:hypothetical protein